MKIKSQFWMILLLLVFGLTACQADQEEAAEGGTVFLPQSSSGSNEQGYPVQEEGYPVQNDQLLEAESAYPVSSTDLQFLNRSWFLYAYQEGGVAMEPDTKTIKFSGNTFEITTEEGIVAGKWSARIDSPDPILVLDTNSGGTLFYEIIKLNGTTLILQTAQDQIQILEEYVPVD